MSFKYKLAVLIAFFSILAVWMPHSVLAAAFTAEFETRPNTTGDEVVGEPDYEQSAIDPYTELRLDDAEETGEPINFEADYNAFFEARLNADINANIGEFPDYDALGIPNITTFKVLETATLTIDFGEPVAFDGYAAVNTDVPFLGADGDFVSIKLDGNEIEIGETIVTNEGINGGLRLTVFVPLNNEITGQPVDISPLPEFTVIEISFTVYPQTPVQDEPAEPEPPPFDPAAEYMAYLGVQSQNFIFREAWYEKRYGIDGEEWAMHDIGNNFYGLTGWVEGSAAIMSGTFTDCVIKGDGTYRVELNDYDFRTDQFFNKLFIATNIPRAANLSFTDVKITVGEQIIQIFPEAHIFTSEDKLYYEIGLIDIWNDNLSDVNGLFDYITQTKGALAVEFTVSGFGFVNPDTANDKIAEPEEEPTFLGETPAGLEPAFTAASNIADDDIGFPVWIIIVTSIGICAIAAIIISSVMKGK